MITTLTGIDAINLARGIWAAITAAWEAQCAVEPGTEPPPPFEVQVRGEYTPWEEAANALEAGALRPEDITLLVPGAPVTTPDDPVEAPPTEYPSPTGNLRGTGLPTSTSRGTDATGGRWEFTTNHNFPPGHTSHRTGRKLG